MYISETKIRVRYGETDQMGYLYYGNYALYYEVGRSEAFRSLGISYRDLEAAGIMMPVVELQVQYFRPAYYDDLITVRTTIKEMPIGSKIVFHSALFNESGKLLNTGVTTLVFYNNQEKQKVIIPNHIEQCLAPFFLNQQDSK
ncbi:MAG: acyl-CoA thioesterase [Bacteroidetes bacterium]|nr:acyl-CoA thioesterase [Bacteroidota bacterium]MBS1738922.1 acyl-CoA thioesterase [Bacteroidota bacterium]